METKLGFGDGCSIRCMDMVRQCPYIQITPMIALSSPSGLKIHFINCFSPLCQDLFLICALSFAMADLSSFAQIADLEVQ